MNEVLYKYFNNNTQNKENKEKKYESKTSRLKHLMKENSDLIERNRLLEERLKNLEQYIITNPVQTTNSNIYNINLNNNKYQSSLKNERTKSPQYNHVNHKFINISKSNNLNKSSKKLKSKIINNRNKKNNLTINNNINKSYNFTRSKNIVTDITNDSPQVKYDLKILKEMLEEKNNEIENLEYELKLQKMAERGEGYLDYELNLWQNKINTLTTSFYQEFNNLKSEAYLDKNEFQNLIRNMKKICEKNQSYEENICQEIINKQIWFINSLDNKNKDIKRRLEKMKNIFK